jgi:hypothetical protein
LLLTWSPYPPPRTPCVMQPGSVAKRLRPAAALSLVCYAVGLPLSFLVILIKHRKSILEDQAMRVVGQGATEATNPYFHIRTRYQELYRWDWGPAGGAV